MASSIASSFQLPLSRVVRGCHPLRQLNYPYSRPSGYPYKTSTYSLICAPLYPHLVLFIHTQFPLSILVSHPSCEHHVIRGLSPSLYSVSSSTIDAINLWPSVFFANHSTRPSLPRYSVSVAVSPAFTHGFHNGGVAKLISTTHAIATPLTDTVSTISSLLLLSFQWRVQTGLPLRRRHRFPYTVTDAIQEVRTMKWLLLLM